MGKTFTRKDKELNKMVKHHEKRKVEDAIIIT